jgi:flagellar motor switch protein FliG
MGNILRRGVAAYQRTLSGNFGKESGLIKTAKAGTFTEAKKSGQAGESRYRRVAKFLVLIGGEQAAGILSELDQEQVEEISREIAFIKGIGAEEGEAILDEFRSLLSMPYRYSGSSSGGVEAARRILYAAMGPEKGESLLNRVAPDSKENIFGFLEGFNPEQVAFLLKEEAASAAALILSRLPAKMSAAVLGKFPSERKPDILRRMAHKTEVSPEVLERVASAMKEKARYVGSAGGKDVEIDGMQALAAILKQGDYAFGDRIIGELEMNSPAIGRDLKEKLYTLDDIVGAVDRPLQEKLKTMSDRDIAVLLKGRGIAFGEKILSCVSSGRGELIRQEGEILGPVPKRDCDAAARDFLAWFRLAREKGDIPLAGDEDVLV